MKTKAAALLPFAPPRAPDFGRAVFNTEARPLRKNFRAARGSNIGHG